MASYDIIDMDLEENSFLKFGLLCKGGQSEIVKQRKNIGDFSYNYFHTLSFIIVFFKR